MRDDFAKTGALRGHGAGTTLTEADAMTLANSFQDNFVAVIVQGESVAGNSVPSQAADDRKTAVFGVGR